MQLNNPYLENEIKSATPQRLRLMLIEGAMRFAHKAQQHLARDEAELANAAAGRLRSILAELLDSIDGESEVSDHMRAVYALILTQLTADEAADPDRAYSKALEALSIERETWQRVCEQQPHIPMEVQSARNRRVDVTTADAARILEESRDDETNPSSRANDDRGEGFCMEA